MGKRIDWIDCAKGIGCILVVSAHAMPKDTIIWIMINQFHMPLFFVISGFLLKTDIDFMLFIKKKAKALYLPYVISGICTYLVSMLINTDYSINTFKNLLKAIMKLILMIQPGPLLGATWFLASLLLAEVIVYGLNRTNNFAAIKTIAVCTMFLLGINTHLPYKISTTLVATFFVYLGFYVNKISLEHKYYSKYGLIATLASSIILFLSAPVNRVSFSTNTYQNKILFIPIALVGIVGVYSLSILSVKRKNIVGDILIWLGKNSIAILIWQFIAFKIITLIQIIYYKEDISNISMFPYFYTSIIWVLLYTLAGVFLPSFCFTFIKRIKKQYSETK